MGWLIWFCNTHDDEALSVHEILNSFYAYVDESYYTYLDILKKEHEVSLQSDQNHI